MSISAFRTTPHRADLSRAARLVPIVCFATVILFAILVLVGWWQDIAVLKTVRPAFVSMKVNTAISFLLLGAGLLWGHVRRATRLDRVGSTALCIGTMAIALAVLYEYLSGVDLGIDEWFVRDVDHHWRFPPGRFSPITALNFLLLTSAVCLIRIRRAAHRLAQFLVFLAYLSSFQTALEYVVGDTFTFGKAFYTQMAFHTSLLFMVLSVGILVADYRRGLMLVFHSDSAGGFMARRLLAAVILVPPCVNWVALLGQKFGWIDANFSLLIRIEGNMILFAAVIWYHMPLLHLSDRARRRSRAALDASQAQLRLSYERESTARATAERLCQDAQHASRLKDEFLATMSHELRTPINVIQGFAELLADPEALTEAFKKDAICAILRNSKVQSQLIDDLLDVSRIVGGNLKLSCEVVAIQSVVQAAVDTVWLAAQAKQIAISCSFEPQLGTFMGDPLRLQQVLWNLLSNAVKFTKPGGHVEVQISASKGRQQIIVKDDGIGIDADFLPFVFDRFRQQDGTATRRHGGLGLGLAIVRHLVELHGGTVQAMSGGLGQGTTVWVSLPLLVPDALLKPVVYAVEGAHAEEAQEGGRANLLRGLDILIVDDSDDVRLLVKSVLSGQGASVREAGSAAEAFNSVTRCAPDVILSDIGMPEEDGYSLIARLRARERRLGGHIPAAALTAFTREEERRRSLAAGFEVHIDKPVNAVTLVRHVASLAATRAPNGLKLR